MIVTRIAPEVGYDTAAELAKKAFEQNKTIIQIVEESDLKDKEKLLEKLKA